MAENTDMKRRTFLQNGGKFAGMGLMALSQTSNSKAQVIRSGKRIKIGQIGTTHAHAMPDKKSNPNITACETKKGALRLSPNLDNCAFIVLNPVWPVASRTIFRRMLALVAG